MGAKQSQSMKACIRDSSSPNGFLGLSEVPVPKLKAGEILVKVKAAAINPVDYKIPGFAANKTIGFDFSGEVVSVNEQEEAFEIGDRVFGKSTTGSLAEYTRCKVNEITLKPDTLSWVEAAAMPIVYLTGLQALRNGGTIEGKNILIVGASGGCGTAGVQLASAMGAKEVVGVCSGANADFVKSLGATDIVDYKSETILERYQPKYFDFVYDTASGSGAGEDYFETCKTVKKDDVMHVAINGSGRKWMRKMFHVQEKHFNMVMTTFNRDDLETILQYHKSSDLRPVIHAVYDFDEENLVQAFEALKSRRSRGKIVIQVAKED